MLTGPNDPRHGTENGYGNHRCRCAACREAHRVYWTERAHLVGRHRPRAVEVAERPKAAHGTEARYTSRGNRCRCERCREAATAARLARRAANSEAGAEP